MCSLRSFLLQFTHLMHHSCLHILSGQPHWSIFRFESIYGIARAELKIATMAWISPLPLLNFHPNHPEMQFFAKLMAIGKAPANDGFLPEVQLRSSSGLT